MRLNNNDIEKLTFLEETEQIPLRDNTKKFKTNRIKKAFEEGEKHNKDNHK